jgi:hypothetical protein
MKALVSALALGLVLAFSAPAFASTSSAYVGDMIGGKPAPKAAKTAENTGMFRHHARRHVY